MKLLLTINEQDLSPDSPVVDTSKFKSREAARAVLLDPAGQVYLLNVGLHGYHKLPGGGIDEGEDVEAALRRELLEEVGCEAEITSILGKIVEYRDFETLKQISYCFLAKQSGEQKPAALEEAELAEGMYEVKAKSLSDAIRLLERDKPNNLEGAFIQRRDICFLKAAQASGSTKS